MVNRLLGNDTCIQYFHHIPFVFKEQKLGCALPGLGQFIELLVSRTYLPVIVITGQFLGILGGKQKGCTLYEIPVWIDKIIAHIGSELRNCPTLVLCIIAVPEEHDMSHCPRSLEMHDLRNNFIDLLAHRFSLPGGSNQNIPHQAHSMGKTVFHELHLPDGGSSLAHQFQDIIGEALYTGLHPEKAGPGQVHQLRFGQVGLNLAENPQLVLPIGLPLHKLIRQEALVGKTEHIISKVALGMRILFCQLLKLISKPHHRLFSVHMGRLSIESAEKAGLMGSPPAPTGAFCIQHIFFPELWEKKKTFPVIIAVIWNRKLIKICSQLCRLCTPFCAGQNSRRQLAVRNFSILKKTPADLCKCVISFSCKDKIKGINMFYKGTSSTAMAVWAPCKNQRSIFLFLKPLCQGNYGILLLEHGDKRYYLGLLLHNPLCRLFQVILGFLLGLPEQGKSLQSLLLLSPLKHFTRKMCLLHPCNIFIKRAESPAMSRCGKDGLAGKIVVSVAYGAHLHYSAVVIPPHPCGIVEIFMLDAAGYAGLCQHCLEHRICHAGHILVAEGHCN